MQLPTPRNFNTGPTTTSAKPRGTLLQLYEMMEKHDWFYLMTESRATRQKGYLATACIESLANGHGQEGEELLSQYRGHIFDDKPKPLHPVLPGVIDHRYKQELNQLIKTTKPSLATHTTANPFTLTAEWKGGTVLLGFSPENIDRFEIMSRFSEGETVELREMIQAHLRNHQDMWPWRRDPEKEPIWNHRGDQS